MLCLRSFLDWILSSGRWGIADLCASLWFVHCTPTKADLHFQNSLSSSSLRARGDSGHHWSQRKPPQCSAGLRLACTEFKEEITMYLYNCRKYLVPIIKLLTQNSTFCILDQVKHHIFYKLKEVTFPFFTLLCLNTDFVTFEHFTSMYVFYIKTDLIVTNSMEMEKSWVTSDILSSIVTIVLITDV